MTAKAKAKPLPGRRVPRHGKTFSKPSRTKQSFKDETNINKIVAKFQKTGMITHVNKNAGSYGYATSQDFRESLEMIRIGRELFASLPSAAREAFGNDVEKMLDYMQDPANKSALEDPKTHFKDFGKELYPAKQKVPTGDEGPSDGPVADPPKGPPEDSTED